MPKLADVGRRSRDRMKTLGGEHFFGKISPAPESQGRGTQFFIPRRILEVHPSCQVTEGTIILDPSGRKLLTGWNGEDNTSRTFKLYDLDQSVSWKRAVTAVDPVTELDKESSEAELGPIWVAIELVGNVEDTLHIPLNRYRVLCNVALVEGDRIKETLVVRSFQRSLGITIAEVW
jgi:hypothetical protein